MSQALAGQPSQRLANPWLLDTGLVVGGSLLMAACAHVSVTLWFTPVPITLQTFGVIFLALTFGGWRASAAMVLYLMEGVSGLPVFSPHGPGGIMQLLGPTGGFLMAYPFAALAGGLIAEKFAGKSRLTGFSFGAIVCELLIFAFGATWLFALSHLPVAKIFSLAILPFLPGEILKGCAAVAAAMGKDLFLKRI